MQENTNDRQSKNRWILLVEDDDNLRSATGKMLANEGEFRVTGVSDARSAILICRGIVKPDFSSSRARFKFDPKFNISTKNSKQQFDCPDCLVLDIRLGGSMDGLDLLRIVRSDPLLESLPVVLLTAKGKVEDRLQGYNAGADAYLPKPFDPEELLSIVNSLITKDKLSASGNDIAKNGNRDSEVYADLKRELREIKDLMNEIGSHQSTASGSKSTNSIQNDIMNMKEVIRSSVKEAEEKNVPPRSQSTSNAHDQFSELTVLSIGESIIVCKV